MSLPASSLPKAARYAPRLSQFWIPTGGITPLGSNRRDGSSRPAEDVHARLVRASFVHPTAHAGIYQTLPLGQRVQAKLEALLDRRMQRDLGAAKLALSTLSPTALWRKSGRLPPTPSDPLSSSTGEGRKERAGPASEFFSLRDRKGADFVLAPTHEEEITSLVKARLGESPRALPLRLYQISRKYRDELRPRKGLLRTREFVMKDLYTFDADEAVALRTYDAVRRAYAAFLAEDLKMEFLEARADSGAIGGDLSHEFHILSPSGEDELLQCGACRTCVNAEVMDPPAAASQSQPPACSSCSEPLSSHKSIELAHAFHLGTKYSQSLGLLANLPAVAPAADDGAGTMERRPLQMGCYGVGVSRLIAAAAELRSDARGLGWPRAIAPFEVAVLLQQQQATVGPYAAAADAVLAGLLDGPSVDAVLDDRERPLGWKLFDADLIGYPVLVVLGRGVGAGTAEVQCRRLGVRRDVRLEDVPGTVRALLKRL